mgnify:CR=1 FL=1
MGKIFSGDERELDPASWSVPEILRQEGWKNYALPRGEAPGKQAPRRLRILGVSTKTRSQFLPQVPAIAESGFPDYIYASWFGLLGPAGADATLVQRVNTEMNKLLASPAIAERILKLGIEPQPLSVAAFGELLRVEAERTARVIKISGAKAE